MTIKPFSSFISEKKTYSDTAGIAIVFEDKLLLVHPANGSWVRPLLGIPKGQIEAGEDLMEAAIRETFEETGILIKPEQLNPSVETVEIWNNGVYRNSLHYFVCRIKSLDEIGLTELSVPKHQLQKEEIDWAGFIKVKEAYPKVSRYQLIILDRLS